MLSIIEVLSPESGGVHSCLCLGNAGPCTARCPENAGEKGKGLGHSRKQTGLGCPHNNNNRIIGKQMPSFCVQSTNVMEDYGKHGWNSILKDWKSCLGEKA